MTRLLDALNRHGKALAVRLRGGLHPKHLIHPPWQAWYLPYLKAGDRVLDLGCGTGAHARLAVTRSGGLVVGLDRARPRLWAMAVIADMTEPLPFRDASFDAVLCLDVIEHVALRQRVLVEISRVLTPAGRVMLSAPNRETTWRGRLRDAGLFAYSDPDHKIEYTAGTFRQEIKGAGLRVLTPLEPVVYDTPWAGLIDVIGGVSLPLYRRLMEWKRARAVADPRESTGFRVVACRA